MIEYLLVAAEQDEDLESDEDTLRGGINSCHRDLIEVKNYFQLSPDKVKRDLKNFKRYNGLF